MEICLQGIYYDSIKEAAEKHGLKPAQLSYRIAKYGKDNPNLFSEGYSIKNIVELQGKTYKTVEDAARKHHMLPTTLRARIDQYGTNSKHLFEESYAHRKPSFNKTPELKNIVLNHKNAKYEYQGNIPKDTIYLDKHNFIIKRKDSNSYIFVIDGQYFATMTQAAKGLDISLAALSRRLMHAKKGSQHDLQFLFKKRWGLGNIQIGKLTFKSYIKAAEYYDMSPNSFKNTYLKYGNDPTKYGRENMKSWQYKHIYLNGKYIGDRDEICKKYGLTKADLHRRLRYYKKHQGHGNVFAPLATKNQAKKFIIFDKTFSSVYQAAKYYHVPYYILANEIKKYGHNASKWPNEVLNRVKTKINEN